MKMRLLAVSACLIVCVWARQERYQDGGGDAEVDKLTQKLWLEIQKRLQDFDDKDDGLDTEQCKFQSKDGMIIRTKDSLDAGANFLSSPTVTSREECEEECCESDDCNLAVFKAKVSTCIYYLWLPF